MTSRRRRRLAFGSFIVIVAICLAAVVFQALSSSTPTSSAFGGSSFWDETMLVGFAFAFAAVGMVILSRQPWNTIGWLFMGIGLPWSLAVLTDGYARYTILVQPGALPGGPAAAAWSAWVWIPGVMLIGTFLLLLFPDGHLPSRRWWLVSWMAAGSMVFTSAETLLTPGKLAGAGFPRIRNPFGIEALHPLVGVLAFAVVLIPLSVGASVIALVLRYRRSRGQERLQMKWLTTAAGASASLYLAVGVITLSLGSGRGPSFTWFQILQAASLLSLALIPVACGFAILRHRLYDIDIVINKALVYGSLAVFITAVYVAIVVGVGRAVGSGGNPNVGLSIVATAVVAVGFQPVRERIQRLANRLVYGRRATPYEVLSEFSTGMAHAVAIEDLLPHMARIVAEGTGAARVDVWLHLGSAMILEATSAGSRGQVRAMVPSVHGDDVSIEGADATIPVRHQGELLGLIGVMKDAGEAMTPAETKLLDDLAAQAGLVLRNVRLIEELKESRQRLVTAQDEERRRLERDLHDGAQQRMVAISLVLQLARRLVPGDADSGLGARLEQASEQVSLALSELRDLARGIHPAILTDRGLVPALLSLAERSTVPTTVDSTVERRLPAPVEATAYFVVSEGLANIAKYSRASTVLVTAREADGALSVVVEDDGVGGADASRGSGLRGLADRVAVVNGALGVESPRRGGTRLVCRIPVAPIDTATVAPRQLETPAGGRA
ncbi:MAG TPA: histidine kinase [Candidatus Dormibacteraeota bacterium]|jgi:signal transduction histidine kinase|nr:histidine kinase [Candidatus Dormibacteraeota bacterium]